MSNYAPVLDVLATPPLMIFMTQKVNNIIEQRRLEALYALRKYIADNCILLFSISLDSQWSQYISKKRWGSVDIQIMLHVSITVFVL